MQVEADAVLCSPVSLSRAGLSGKQTGDLISRRDSIWSNQNFICVVVRGNISELYVSVQLGLLTSSLVGGGKW